MSVNFLEKLFEHNNWANQHIIQVCSKLSDDQLDAEPRSATKGSIRQTLWHTISAQQSYLSHLTGTDYRSYWQAPPSFDELGAASTATGKALLALARGDPSIPLQPEIHTRDGYRVEPWVIIVQIINHATEHREQINSMLSSLGVTPPELDGWSYGEATNALVPMST